MSITQPETKGSTIVCVVSRTLTKSRPNRHVENRWSWIQCCCAGQIMRALHPRELIRRHWRGEFSLPLSFWGDGIVGVLVFYTWVYVIQVAFLNTFNPYLNIVG